MKDERKTKQQLIAELDELRHQVAEALNAPEKTVEGSSQGLYHGLFNAIADAVLIFDQESLHILDCNQAALDAYGYTLDELRTMTPLQLHPAEDMELARRNIDDEDDYSPHEYTHVTKDGERVRVEIKTEESLYGDRPVWVSTVRDITDLRRVEDALGESEERYRSVVDSSPLGIFVSDVASLLYVNQRLAEITGYSPQELLDMADPVRTVFAPEEQERVTAYATGRLDTGTGPTGYEVRGVRKDGRDNWLKLTVSSVELGGQTVLQGIIEDVTERRRMEEALRSSERRLREILETVQLVAVTLDREGNIAFCNDFLLALTGWRQEQVLGRNWFELFLPDQVRPEIEEMFARAVKGGSLPSYYENEIVTQQGESRMIAWNNTSFRGPQGNVVSVTSIGEDITERRRAEEALRASEERYRSLFDNSLNGIALHEIVTDEQGKPVDYVFLQVNRAFEDLTGLAAADIIGKRVTQVIPGIEQESFIETYGRVALTGEPIRFEQYEEYLARHYEIVAFSLYGGTFATMFRDITARKQMEASLQEDAERLEQLVLEKVRELDEERAKVVHTAKLAALGQMATGVAHELNQPLTAILLEGEHLKRVTRLDEYGGDAPALDLGELHRIGEHITEDVARCSRIINHLRTFSRAVERERTEVNLNQPIQDAFILVGRRLEETDVEVRLQLDPNLPPILADLHQVEQVFLNLISNAEQAMEEMARRVKEDATMRPEYCKLLLISTRVEGDDVIATVQDNGVGISDENREHIFEPFFTTKPVGEGTGLGLSVSYGIVKKFGGEITFDSGEEEGTVFTLRFPVAKLSAGGGGAGG